MARPVEGVVRIWNNRRTRRIVNVVSIAFALVVTVLAARHFASAGWPFAHADPVLLTCASLLFLSGYFFKAHGWRLLFAKHERPETGGLAVASGAACLTGVALPGRFDDAVRVVVLMPRLVGSARLVRFRLTRWLAEHAPSTREATKGFWFVLISWLVRGAGLCLLLGAFGIGLSLPLAIAFLTAGAASAALPVAPAGAATQVGAGSAMLMASGVGTSQAIAFAIAAQTLVIFVAAAVVLGVLAWELVGRRLGFARVA